MHQILAYIKFLFKSTNQHGVHSPFVFDLLTKCIYKKETKPGFPIIEAYRKAILNDHRTIKVKDFGAGSRVFKSDERKVSAIAKNAGIPKKRAFLLNKIISYFNTESALELGTSVGISSAAIVAGNKVHLTTLEGCPETAKIAMEYFERFGFENIELVVGRFESPPTPKRGKNAVTSYEQKEKGALELYLESVGNAPPRPAKRVESKIAESTPTNQNQQPTTVNRRLTTDLIYFDGNHQKEATLRYFHQLLPLVNNDSIFIFDDIHWSREMEEAWEEIKKHPEVRVSIDSFFWGIIFFRKEQKKEHFTIRM